MDSPIHNGDPDAEIRQLRQRVNDLEIELTQVHAWFDALKSSYDYVYVKDIERQFVDANHNVIELLGKSQLHEVVGRKDEDFFLDQDGRLDEYIRDEKKVLLLGEVIYRKRELSRHATRNEDIWFSTTKIPIKRDDRVVGLLGINRNITDLIRDKQQQHLYERLFEATLTHHHHRALWDAIATLLAEEFGTRSSGLYKYDAKRRVLELVAQYKRPNDLDDEMPVDGLGLAPRLVRDYIDYLAGLRGIPDLYVTTNDYSSNSNSHPDHVRLGVLEAVCLVLLLHNNIPVGVIYIEDKKGRNFRGEDCERLLEISPHIAQSLVYADDLRRITVETRQALVEATRDESLKALVETAQRSLRCDVAVLFVYEPRTESLLHPPVSGGELYFKEAVEASGVVKRERIPYDILEYEKDIFYANDAVEHGEFARREQISAFIAVRLQTQTSKVGVLFLNYRRGHDIYEQVKSEPDLIQFYGNRLALAVERQQQVAYLKRIRNTVSIITDSTLLDLDKETTLRTYLQRVVNSIEETLLCDFVSLYIYDNSQNQFAIPAIRSQGFKGDDPVFEADSAIYQILKASSLYVYPDINDILFSNNKFVKHVNIKSFAAIAISINIGEKNTERKVGVLLVNHLKKYHFQDSERDDISLIAKLLGTALHNAEAFSREQQLRHFASNISQIISPYEEDNEDNLELIGVAILDAISDVIRYDAATIQSIHHLDDPRLNIASRGKTEKQNQEPFFVRPVSSDRLINGIVANKAAYIIDDTHDRRLHLSGLWDFLPETQHIRSWMGIPLVADDVVLGIIILEAFLPHAFTYEQGNAILTIFVNQAATIALSNFKARERIQQRRQIINNITTAIIAPTGLQQILEGIPALVSEFMHEADLVEVMMYEGDQLVKRSSNAVSNSIPLSIYDEVIPAAMVARRVIDQLEKGDKDEIWTGNREIIDIPDWIHKHPDSEERFDNRQSAMIIALVAEERFLGILNIEHKTRGIFNMDDVMLAGFLDSLVVIAIQRSEDLVSLKDVMALSLSSMIESHNIPKRHANNILRTLERLGRTAVKGRGYQRFVVRLFNNNFGSDLDQIRNEATAITSFKPEHYPVGSNTEAMPLNETIDKYITSLQVFAREKNLILKFNPFFEEIYICCYPRALVDVLSVLVFNALRFVEAYNYENSTGERHQRVTVSVERDGSFVEILIDDEGIGMDRRHAQLYGRQRNLDHLQMGDKTNWGMGAVMARLVIEAYHGRLSIKRTEIDHGTTISIRFPVHHRSQE